MLLQGIDLQENIPRLYLACSLICQVLALRKQAGRDIEIYFLLGLNYNHYWFGVAFDKISLGPYAAM